MTDEEALAAAFSGEAGGLVTLVERYQQPLTNYLDRLAGSDWALAQDLVQETFLRVLRQRHPRGNRPVRPWLYAIATNLARDHFRSAAHRLTSPLDPDFAGALVDDAALPEDVTLAHEQDAALQTALGSLGVEYRAALLLRFYSDLSLREIAETLDIPIGTVKSRLSVGLQRLRQRLVYVEASQQGRIDV